MPKRAHVRTCEWLHYPGASPRLHVPQMFLLSWTRAPDPRLSPSAFGVWEQQTPENVPTQYFLDIFSWIQLEQTLHVLGPCNLPLIIPDFPCCGKNKGVSCKRLKILISDAKNIFSLSHPLCVFWRDKSDTHAHSTRRRPMMQPLWSGRAAATAAVKPLRLHRAPHSFAQFSFHRSLCPVRGGCV